MILPVLSCRRELLGFFSHFCNDSLLSLNLIPGFPCLTLASEFRNGWNAVFRGREVIEVLSSVYLRKKKIADLDGDMAF